MPTHVLPAMIPRKMGTRPEPIVVEVALIALLTASFLHGVHGEVVPQHVGPERRQRPVPLSKPLLMGELLVTSCDVPQIAMTNHVLPAMIPRKMGTRPEPIVVEVALIALLTVCILNGLNGILVP
jgi:hypothetical protein